MIKNLDKEEKFYANKNFAFSYSSLNKLLFSPWLFYKDYILQDRDIKTDKHLVEGKLVHCLVFEPENLTKKFNVVPGKSPTDNVRKVLKNIAMYTTVAKLEDVKDSIILDSLKDMNLYQSLKADEARIAKVKTLDNESLFKNEETDFDLDPVTTYAEKYIKSNLEKFTFGLHGYVDYYTVDAESKTVVICDLKTSGKTVDKFSESVDFYNYWLQASIYSKMVYDSLGDDRDEYTIIFKFIVIDKYNQVYVYDVSQESMGNWAEGLNNVLKIAEYHYTKRDYSLPYELLVKKVKL